MDFVTFLILYIIFLFIIVALEIYIIRNDKGKYIRRSYEGLLSIIAENIDTQDTHALSNEIESFYNRYYQVKPDVKRLFPNVIVWIDEIILRIDFKFKGTEKLQEYNVVIKAVRNMLGTKYPFSKCEKEQQNILRDIARLENQNNKIIIDNILGRAEEEFLRLSSDIKKNRLLNIISITIGIVGIIVSILMALMKV